MRDQLRFTRAVFPSCSGGYDRLMMMMMMIMAVKVMTILISQADDQRMGSLWPFIKSVNKYEEDDEMRTDMILI